MADNNQDIEVKDLTQEQAIAGFKLQMALQEIEKQGQLNDFFEKLQIGPNREAYGTEAALEKFQADFDPQHAAKNLEIVKSSYPDIYAAITKEIEDQNLESDLEPQGLTSEDFDPAALDTLKTVKAFEDRFPNEETPSLKERLGAIKDSLLKAKETTNGKIVFNSVMLGVALGTGGVGVIAGVKLAAAVGQKLMENPKVAALAASVTEKATTYMKESLNIPVDEIKQGIDKVKAKTVDNKKFKLLALGAMALTAGGLGIHHLLESGVTVDSAADYAMNKLNNGVIAVGDAIHHAPEIAQNAMDGTHDALVGTKNFAAEHLGFDSADHGVAAVDPGVSVPSPDAGTIPAPVDGTAPVGAPSVDATSVATPEAGVSGAAPAGVEAGAGHVVAKHDSMWKVVKHALGPDATNQDIANGVKDMIAANPQIHNPNLIFPGDVLKMPEGLANHLAAAPATFNAKDLAASIDTSGLNPLGHANLKLPIGVDAPTPVSTGGVTAADLASNVKAVPLAPTFDGVKLPDFEQTSIQPNPAAGSRFAELAKTTAAPAPKFTPVKLEM